MKPELYYTRKKRNIEIIKQEKIQKSFVLIESVCFWVEKLFFVTGGTHLQFAFEYLVMNVQDGTANNNWHWLCC